MKLYMHSHYHLTLPRAEKILSFDWIDSTQNINSCYCQATVPLWLAYGYREHEGIGHCFSLDKPQIR